MNERSNHFYNYANKIDELINYEEVNYEIINSALELAQKNNSLMRYFILHLIRNEKSSWFLHLNSIEFFNEIINIEKKEGNLFPCLNKLDYVKVCAQYYPKEVYNLIKQIKPGNQLIFNKLINIISNQKVSIIPDYIPIITDWLDSGVVIEIKEYFSIIEKLENSRKWNYAKNLLIRFLSPKSTETEKSEEIFQGIIGNSIVSLHLLQAFMQTLFKEYLNQYPESLLDISISCLRMNKNLEEKISWWRSAIEENEQNTGETLGDYLITIIRDAIITLSEIDNKRTLHKLNELLQLENSIYHRIVIYIISEKSMKFPTITKFLYDEKKFLEETQYHHEYWHFINATFEKQRKEVKDNFLGYLFHCYDNKIDKYHLLRWLWAVKDALSGKYKDKYLQLLNELGKPDHPDFLSYSRSLGGPLSPVDKEDLLSMNREQILEVLNSEIPVEAYGEIAQEGFVLVLQEAVKENPTKFADLSDVFDPTTIPPLYVYHFIEGLRDGWKSGKYFSLEPVLRQINKLLQMKDEELLGYTDDLSLKTLSMKEIQRNILRLLSSMIRTEDHEIQNKYLIEIKEILLDTFKHLESIKNEKERIAKIPSGVINLAINDNQAIAVEALINCAIHYANTTFGRPSQEEHKFENEVIRTLEEILITNKVMAVHSIFGKYFPNFVYLDKEWAEKNKNNIFPLQENEREKFVSAWASYLYRGDFFNDPYIMLRDQYQLGIDLPEKDDDYGTGVEKILHNIYYHLYFAFWHGLEPMFSKESLIQNFLLQASDYDISKFISGLGSGLKVEQPNKDSQQWLDLKRLWNERFNYLRNAELEEVKQELTAFLSWIPYIPEDLTEYYDDIQFAALSADTHFVFDLLDYMIKFNKHIPFTVSLFNEILITIKEPWGLFRSDEHFSQILKKGMQLEGETRENAIEAINRLGELGFEQYRPLLDI